MKVERDEEDRKIVIYDEANNKLLEAGFMYDEFTIILFDHKKVTLEKGSKIYDEFNKIMSNKYEFNNNISSESKNRIIWLSDDYGDIDDELVTNKINRLVIEKDENDDISLSCFNPFFDKYEIQRSFKLISFSPAGNGQYSKNLETGLTFQDDIVNLFNTIFDKEENNRVAKKYTLLYE